MLSFLSMSPAQQADATAWLAKMPRATRKAFRPMVQRNASSNVASHGDVVSYMQTEYRTDTYHTQNLEFLDRAYDFDEFQDIDDEFAALTIHEPDSETALWGFCTGYDII